MLFAKTGSSSSVSLFIFPFFSDRTFSHSYRITGRWRFAEIVLWQVEYVVFPVVFTLWAFGHLWTRSKWAIRGFQLIMADGEEDRRRDGQ